MSNVKLENYFQKYTNKHIDINYFNMVQLPYIQNILISTQNYNDIMEIISFDKQ